MRVPSRFINLMIIQFLLYKGAMRLLVAIGFCVFLALCVLEAIHFRRALIVMAIPGFVILLSAFAILRNNPRLLWPIIGISVGH